MGGGVYLGGDVPEPQEQFSDIRLVQPAGLEVGPELAGLASFGVWKVDTQAPSELSVKLHSDSQEIREHPTAAWGWWGEKTGAVVMEAGEWGLERCWSLAQD